MLRIITLAIALMLTFAAQTQVLKLNLSKRPGVKPSTTKTMPHVQQDQNAPDSIWHVLAYWVYNELSGVEEKPSLVSVKGARALSLKPGVHIKDKAAIMKGREFAHMHPLPDGSWHVSLKETDAAEVVKKGWGEYHPLVELGMQEPTMVMVYGPRDSKDLKVLKKIIRRSYYFATGLVK